MSVPQLRDRVSVAPAPILRRAVVSASGLVRRYGKGDVAVDALRQISLEIDEARLPAIMLAWLFVRAASDQTQTKAGQNCHAGGRASTENASVGDGASR